MRLIFCASQSPGSLLIRAATWSPWSHVAIVDGDDAIEAVCPTVRVSPLVEVIARHSSFAFATLPCANPVAAINAARSQIGKPYDLKALVGMALHRDWQEDDSWFCSELVAWAIAQGGTPLFRPDAVRRVTPQHLWMLNPTDDLEIAT